MKRSIVCRCEDISEEDVIQVINEGYTDIEELRKKLRIGCIQLVARILENKTGKKVATIPRPTVRPPLIPVSLGTLASEKDEK
jgi:NAD(P)H-nitrite reductase large subunit